MLLAQELTVVTESDPWLVGASIAAVAIALVSLVWTWVQGRAIRNIETREHAWQETDRRSANVEVTSHREVTHLVVKGYQTVKESHWLRLRNSGRSRAINVQWSVTDDGPELVADRRSLDILHPGEHFDVWLALDQSVAPGWLFTTYWEDENGKHFTERRISL